MRKYGAFSGLWRAAGFSKGFYQDVAANWRGIGVWYLILVLSVVWLAMLIQVAVQFSGYLDHRAADDLREFPPITITKGVASSPVTQPYVMHDKAGDAILGLDTTGATTLPSALGVQMLLRQNELVQEQPGAPVRRDTLAPIPDGTYDKGWLIAWGKVWRNWMVPLGLPVLVVIGLVWRLVWALILGGIGLAIASAFRARLTYAAALRLAVVSMTGPLILETVLNLLGVSTACWGLLVFGGMTIGYLVFGIWAASKVLPVPEAVVWQPELGEVPPPGVVPPGGAEDQFP